MHHRIRPILNVLLIALLFFGGLPFSAPPVQAAQPVPAPAGPLSPTAGDWSPMQKGMDNRVKAVAIDSKGIVYAGGAFFHAAGCINGCNNIAKWDGNTWLPLGTGVNDMVTTIVVDPKTDDVYVGGTFTSAAPCTQGCTYIAKWDGSTWTALGTGITGTAVYKIAINPNGVSDGLYVGGMFTDAGNCISESGCNNIAKWNGTSWSPLNTGTDGAVASVAVSPGGTVVAAGMFATAGNCNLAAGCYHIAEFNPGNNSWSSVGTGIPNGDINTVAFNPSTGTLYAGGTFTTAGSCNLQAGCKYIAQWDGTTWAPLGTGVNQGVLTIQVDPNTGIVYAGGAFTIAGSCNSSAGCNRIAQWNDTTWAPLGTGLDGTIRAIAISPSGEIFAGGDFTSAGTCDTNVGCNFIASFIGGPPAAKVTFGAAPSPTYLTDTSFTVSATSDNTDDPSLTYSWVSGPCALVSGATFSFTAAGDCVVKAESPATTNFSAGSNTQTVTIAKAQPVISFTNSANFNLTDLGFAAAATTTNTDSPDLTFSYVSGTSDCSKVGGANFVFSTAGTCVIKADSAATANFLGATQQFTVTISNLVITFLPAPSPTYLGGIFFVGAGSNNTDPGGDILSFSVDSGPCTLVSANMASLNSNGAIFNSTGAGDCVVKATSPATTNFGAGSQTLTVTIAKAQPVISFSSSSSVMLSAGSFTAAATTTNADSSSLVYSYVSGPCSFVSGAEFLPTSKGVCVVQADGAPTANFLAATQQQSVTISDIVFTYLPLIANEPAAANWNLNLGYEDQSVASGLNDYDYNDWIVKIDGQSTLRVNTNLTREVTMAFTPQARGAAFDHSFAISLPASLLTSGGSATLTTYDGAHAQLSSKTTLFASGVTQTFVIFDSTKAALPGILPNVKEVGDRKAPSRYASLTLTFDTGIAIGVAQPTLVQAQSNGLFFDPILTVLETGEQVHQGDIRLLSVPVSNWKWAEEGVRIDKAYPLVSFSAGVTPVIVFPDAWWLTHNTCVYDGHECVLP